MMRNDWCVVGYAGVMAPPQKRVTDPRVLRAIAHPTRVSLLSELYARGRARAADLAPLVGMPANSVSFHLRQLARYGLIERDPESVGDGRDRWWRVAAEGGLTWTSAELEAQPGGRAALSLWRRATSEWVHAAIDAYFSEPGKADEGTARVMNDVTVLLTKQEAQQLSLEVGDVFTRWSERGRQADDDETRRTYLALAFVQPMPHPAGQDEE